MKRLLLILLVFFLHNTVLIAQNYIKIDTSFYSEILKETKFIDVFLPPDYFINPDQDYAVIYYLHGAGGNQNSGYDEAVKYYNTHYQSSHNNPPAIFVCMDGSCEPYRGSFYLNSILYGNYGDYTILDVIGFVDSNYRSIPHREFRFITGFSMGGFGSAYNAAKHCDMFRACVPCSGPLNCRPDTILNIWKDLIWIENGNYILNYNSGVHNRLLISCCGAWSPNLDILPYYIETPFDSLGNNVDTVIQKWEQFNITSMVQELPDEDTLSWFLICGTNDHMGVYHNYQEFMDSLDGYDIRYDTFYFDGGHTYNEDSWEAAMVWIDSIIDLSFLTLKIPEITGIEHETLTLYPNPVSAILNVQCHQTIEEVLIYDLSGQRYLQQYERSKIDVSSIPAGVYILAARTESGIVMGKFIKR